MKYLRGAAFGLPLAAAALWLVTATTTGAPPAAPARAASSAVPSPSPWFDLERQRARLLQQANAPPTEPARNPFRFGAQPTPQPSRLSVPGLPRAGRPSLRESAPPQESPLPVRLVGMATRQSSDGPARLAILSGLGQVFVAGPGEMVGERYRLTAVGEDAVELRDEATGRLVRLALR
jgi:hypothetical protein